MDRLHELLRHHPAYHLIGRPDALADFERLESRPVIIDEFSSSEIDEPAWRFADAAAAVLVALAAWGLFMLTIGSPGGSPPVKTIAESGDAMDRSR